eukprot:scaffold52862_cov51-Phaeocystis_antarctica.AAC.1
MAERIKGCARRHQHSDRVHVAMVGGVVKWRFPAIVPSTSTDAACPRAAAVCSGVIPVLSLASSAAPAATSALTAFASPVAWCSGVSPYSTSRADRDAPAAASASIADAWP